MKDYGLMDRMNDDYSPKEESLKQDAPQEPQVSLTKPVALDTSETSQKKRGRPSASSSLKDNKSEGAKRYINSRFSEEQYLLLNKAAIKRSEKIGKLLTAPEYVLLALEAFMKEDLK